MPVIWTRWVAWLSHWVSDQDIHALHSKAQLPMCPLQKKVSFQNWTRWLGQDEWVACEQYTCTARLTGDQLLFLLSGLLY